MLIGAVCCTNLSSNNYFFAAPAQTTDVSQFVQEVKIGANVTLKCVLSQNTDGAITWFKQNIGQHPQFVGRLHRILPPALSNEFKNERFNLSNGSGSFLLSIANIQPSDEGSYFCGIIRQYGDLQFGRVTHLILIGK